jgi:hypothetical protein
MAVKKISIVSFTGSTVYCVVKQESTGWNLDDTDGAFRVSVADSYPDLWRGAYSPLVDYVMNDRVSYGGSFYYCVSANGPTLPNFVEDPTNAGYWSSLGSFDPYLFFTEDSVVKGRYDFSENRQVWVDGQYTATAYRQVGAFPSPADDLILGINGMYVKDNSEVNVEQDVSAIDWGMIIPVVSVTVTQFVTTGE